MFILSCLISQGEVVCDLAILYNSERDHSPGGTVTSIGSRASEAIISTVRSASAESAGGPKPDSEPMSSIPVVVVAHASPPHPATARSAGDATANEARLKDL